MKILIGTKKQIDWAEDIRYEAIELLEDKKETRGDLKDYIETAIINIEEIEDAGYLINNLKDISYTKNKEDKFKILVNWMEYTRHEDFKGLLFGLKHKQTDLVEEYKTFSKTTTLKERKKSWIDNYKIVEITGDLF